MKAIPPKNVFAIIWLALVILLFAMFGLAHLPLKNAGTPVILALAVAQMFLVLLFFMRLRSGPKLNRVFAAVGVFWLFFLVALALSDYLTRQWH